MIKEKPSRQIPLVQKYVEAILQGESDLVEQCVQEMIDLGWELRELYLNCFAPALHEIGELWKAGDINVAQEHLATQITLRQMSRIHHLVPVHRTIRKKIIVTTIDSEQHMVGAKMVSDFLSLEGFQVDFLGACTPTRDLLLYVQRSNPDAIVFSITLEEHIELLEYTVRVLQKTFSHLPIAIGGRALLNQPKRAKEIAGKGFIETIPQCIDWLREECGLSNDSNHLEDYLVQLGKKIFMMRKKAKLSQSALSLRAGLDRTYISGVERGKQNVSLGALSKIAEAFHLKINELLDLSEDGLD